MTAEASSHWAPRAIPDLRVFERGNRRLCLNPDVPSWIVTTEPAVLLLKLADGTRTVDEIADLLVREEIPVDPDHVRQFFIEAREMRLFDAPASKEREDHPWRDRKLTAMHLHLTDRCNLECTYCYRNSHPFIPIRHEPSRFIEMFGFIKPFCSPDLRITYCGGEPLTYPGFNEVVEASSQLGFRNELLTNGILITDERAIFIGKHFKKVRISLDGPDKESHAATRGDNFDKVMRGIRRIAAQTSTEVTVQVTVTKSNLTTVGDIKRLLPENVKITFTPMFSMGRGVQDAGFISNDDFLEVSRSTSSDAGERPDALYSPGVAHRSCHAGLGNLSIADTGDVYPCHLFHMGAFHFGNVFHDKFEDIFYGERLRDYVRSMDIAHNNSICSECEMRYLCGGGCKANALHATGDYRGVDLYCSYIKRSIVDNLFNSVEDPESAAQLAPECKN